MESNHEERPLLEKWRNFMRDIGSPDSYINFGFHYMIGAALQRRVWTGAAHKPLFGNTFVNFIAKAGIGKGNVIGPVNEILRYHKMPPPNPLTVNGNHINGNSISGTSIKSAKDILQKAEQSIGVKKVDNVPEERKEEQQPSPHKDKKPIYLFPVGADATSFEALVGALSRSTRYIHYKGNPQFAPGGIYTHCSICFQLDEMGSMFRKNTEDTVRFFHQGYDCKDYEYDTIRRGSDIVYRPCVSLLGAATPQFMGQVFKSELISEGYSSRTQFLFESKNRFPKLIPNELDEQQSQDYLDILCHVKKLSTLVGPAPLTEEALVFLREWWEGDTQERKPNMHPSLEHYYARKNIHVMKLALAIHFADKLTMQVDLQDCVKALGNLNAAEKNMHRALTFDKQNPLAKISCKIENYLMEEYPKIIPAVLLHLQFWDDCNEMQFKEIMAAMEMFDKVEVGTDGRGGTTYKYRQPQELTK